MSKMIQIRNVPEDLHQNLKVRAALAGQSLSEFLLGMIRHASEKLTPEEMRERLSQVERFEFEESAADIIRERRGPLP